jgi:16S rRNA (cytosine967-C5)-methyltransferase
MTSADKSFTTELAYGTLRMQGRHDYLAIKYLDRPITAVDEKIIDLIRIGIHQISHMRVPDHAAVKETVEVAKYVAGESKASYVNAILRKVVADGFQIPESKDWPTIERLSIEYSHPQWIIQSFYEQLKDWQEVEDLLQANNTPVQPDLVCWVGKSNLKQIVELGGKSIDGLSEGFTIPGIPSEFLPVMERRVGVQDRGSQLVVEDFLATAKPNLKWLDMCAGPGGKAAYIYHYLLENFPASIFVANEINKVRAELVKRVVSNNHVIINDGTNASAFLERFDRILIDAPCTGLGALRRRPEARWRKSPQDLKELVSLQRKLLRSAYELLNPGGIIAYVTCSPHLSETKGQVLDFLGSYNDMKLLPLNSMPLKNPSGLQDDGTMQLWTHRNNSDSMFMAFFQREVVE